MGPARIKLTTPGSAVRHASVVSLLPTVLRGLPYDSIWMDILYAKENRGNTDYHS